MYLQEIKNIMIHQLVKIKYDCVGNNDRCGKEWTLKLKDAKKNFEKNDGKHICHKCQMSGKNNPACRKEVREKIKKTSLEKYGTNCALNTKENTKKRKEKMFGCQEAIDARTKKTKKTNLERYGAEHIMQTKEGIERLNKSMQEKYGVDFPLQAEECLEKMKETCQENMMSSSK